MTDEAAQLASAAAAQDTSQAALCQEVVRRQGDVAAALAAVSAPGLLSAPGAGRLGGPAVRLRHQRTFSPLVASPQPNVSSAVIRHQLCCTHCSPCICCLAVCASSPNVSSVVIYHQLCCMHCSPCITCFAVCASSHPGPVQTVCRSRILCRSREHPLSILNTTCQPLS